MEAHLGKRSTLRVASGVVIDIDQDEINQISTKYRPHSIISTKISTTKVHAHFGRTVKYPISKSVKYPISKSWDISYHHSDRFLIKYRPFQCNIDYKFKNIDHLSKMVDYRPMVDNIDLLAALLHSKFEFQTHGLVELPKMFIKTLPEIKGRVLKHNWPSSRVGEVLGVLLLHSDVVLQWHVRHLSQ